MFLVLYFSLGWASVFGNLLSHTAKLRQSKNHSAPYTKFLMKLPKTPWTLVKSQLYEIFRGLHSLNTALKVELWYRCVLSDFLLFCTCNLRLRWTCLWWDQLMEVSCSRPGIEYWTTAHPPLNNQFTHHAVMESLQQDSPYLKESCVPRAVSACKLQTTTCWVQNHSHTVVSPFPLYLRLSKADWPGWLVSNRSIKSS